jgi:hypothetical protein
MANTEQLNVLVTPSHKDLVEKIAKENGWSINATVRKAIREFAGLMIVHAGTAAQMGDEFGAIHQRLVAEFGAARMVNKRVDQATFDDGKVGLMMDDYAFTLEDDGRLLATKRFGDHSEVYEVRDGRLVLAAAFPAGDPQMN